MRNVIIYIKDEPVWKMQSTMGKVEPGMGVSTEGRSGPVERIVAIMAAPHGEGAG